ncbi:hypothetical protein CH299_06200 [Rhodococcus sp. 14-2686-1-2]|nr:hypothetical protein CH301_05655 [Rhodococcus sp. 15-1189-1-1a]OZF18653.1 hypothetical protein CH299_06200 [Rhodococcus sp. 14-2686-1-2]
MIPSRITDASLKSARAIALAEQLATGAGTLDTGWGRIYRAVDNELLHRHGHDEWPPKRRAR